MHLQLFLENKFKYAVLIKKTPDGWNPERKETLTSSDLQQLYFIYDTPVTCNLKFCKLLYTHTSFVTREMLL